MFKRILLLICFSFAVFISYSQEVIECPQNIGFEEGVFSYWKAFTGGVDTIGNYTPFIPGAVPGRHTLIKRGSYESPDRIGGFSLDSPNGSDYVIQLGNDSQGSQAERITYTMNIPSNVDSYSIIFNYAVVFENPLDHNYWEQPKFTASVFDETTNTSEQCASFEFTAQRGLPGFGISNDSVLFKPWSPVFVNLTKYLGHTIRLEFTTNDCTRGGHFGYAYIDIDENCATPVTGNITCPENNSITLKTFPGFAQYRWYNANTKVTYGTKDILTLSPIPPVGTRIAVELVPYPYSGGCTETLYSVIKNMEPIHVKSELVSCISVDLTAKSVTAGNMPGLFYTYWHDAQATKPIADPTHVNITGTYFIMGQLFPSGCFSIVPVTVSCIPLPPIAVNQPSQVSYPETIDLTKTFTPQDGMTYTYWANQDTSIRISTPTRVRVGGMYYIKGVNSEGCTVVTAVRADVVLPDIVIPNTFTPNGDGINDVLTILIDSRIKIKSFRIYSRWGQPVYVTSDINEFWNGYKGSSKVPSGVYFWFLEGAEDSQKYIRHGSVTVIR